ncbi:phage antirepressor protein [Pseudomonas syringae]|uniref:Phage antirepressor protein n=1 Tax=Pseudomonas syringae TaxID=317 RepID=A0A1C7Z3G4_PSESX|nr:Bro-N domain-containing protein [Pseudomonas syringae]OCR23048.1 phage antirepressor protein [Pseudomonas syringae]
MNNLDSPSPRRQPTTEALQPTTFLRHNRQLRTLLLESQVWFCARDFSRLMGWPLNERTTRKLDVDQRRVMVLSNHYGPEEELMVSESGIYEMLVHHCHAENRHLRRWVTNEVVPCLRDDRAPGNDGSPSLSVLQWQELSVCLLHWQSEPWIRLRDMPRMLPHGQLCGDSVRGNGRLPWWRAVWRGVGFG